MGGALEDEYFRKRDQELTEGRASSAGGGRAPP